MLLVENVDDSAFLTKLFEAMYEELPAPPKKEITASISRQFIYAGMMELVDMRDLGSRAAMRWGSSPHTRTNIKIHFRRYESGFLYCYIWTTSNNFNIISIHENRRVQILYRAPLTIW